jgi:hypothetical protein
MIILETAKLIQSILVDILYDLAPYLIAFIDFVSICIELRICISFFLVINPYFPPFLQLWEFTDPFMWSGRGAYPRIFGMDITSMVNYQLLNKLRYSLDYFLYYQQSHRLELDEADLTLNNLNKIDQFIELYNHSKIENFLSHETFNQFLVESANFLDYISKSI